MRLRFGGTPAKLKAMDKLATTSSRSACKSLLRCLGDRDDQVRLAAAKAIGTGRFDRTVQFLLGSLNHSRSEVREAAALSLGYCGDRSACQGLLSLLNDTNPAVRAAAATALRKLGWRPVDREQQAALDVASGNTLAAALAGPAGVEPLVRELSNSQSFVRRIAAQALEHVDDPRKVSPLLAAVNDPDPTVRVCAIHALAKAVGDPVVIKLLKRLVGDRDPRIRLATAQVLTTSKHPDLAGLFLGLLKDGSFEVRLVAVEFLGRMRAPQHVPAMLAMLADADSDVRHAAAVALSEVGSPAAIEGLVLALSDEDQAVRKAAERALENTDANWACSEPARRAGKKLELLLQNKPSWVRAAVGHLVVRLQSTDNSVRAAA
jgi:HEAT repeat protein